jgi:hypothetical protein
MKELVAVIIAWFRGEGTLADLLAAWLEIQLGIVQVDERDMQMRIIGGAE